MFSRLPKTFDWAGEEIQFAQDGRIIMLMICSSGTADVAPFNQTRLSCPSLDHRTEDRTELVFCACCEKLLGELSGCLVSASGCRHASMYGVLHINEQVSDRLPMRPMKLSHRKVNRNIAFHDWHTTEFLNIFRYSILQRTWTV